MKRLAIAISFALLAQAGHSQTIVNDSTNLIRKNLDKAKTSMADRPADLNSLIAGDWHDKVQVKVKSNNLKPSQQDKYLFSWIGDIFVHIEHNGKISFSMSNGCKYNGDYTTFASDTTWSVEGQFENCQISTLNRRIIGRIIQKNKKIFLNLTQTGVTIDPQVTITIRTTFLSRD